MKSILNKVEAKLPKLLLFLLKGNWRSLGELYIDHLESEEKFQEGISQW